MTKCLKMCDILMNNQLPSLHWKSAVCASFKKNEWTCLSCITIECNKNFDLNITIEINNSLCTLLINDDSIWFRRRKKLTQLERNKSTRDISNISKSEKSTYIKDSIFLNLSRRNISKVLYAIYQSNIITNI